MKKVIWVIKGFGSEQPEKVELGRNETVGQFRRKYANELKVSVSDIELSTDTKRLTNDNAILANLVDDEEEIQVIPRAKAGY